MLLQHQTWQEVEAYLTQSKGIILPIGSTEQHGPNGLIGTDAICAEVIARGVGEAAGVLDGLESYASYAGLLEGIVDGFADFVVVQAFF